MAPSTFANLPQERVFPFATSVSLQSPGSKGSLMPKEPPVKPADLSLMSVPAFWSMAMAASLMENDAELYAKNLKFVDEEIKIHDDLRPGLATPNTVSPDG